MSPRRFALAALLTCLLVTSCTSDSKGVVVATVERGDVTEVVDAPAAVVARVQATLSAPAAGTVAEVFVRGGDRVSAGTPLLRIDSPAAVARLRQARDADAAAARGVPRGIAAPDLLAFQAQLDAAAAAGFAAARAAAEQAPEENRAELRKQVQEAEERYARASAQAREALRELQAGLGSVGNAVVAVAGAQRTQTKAAVALAQSAVDALLVRAPIAGTVQLGGQGGGAPGDLSSLIGQLPPAVQGQAASALGSGGSGTAQTTVLDVRPGVPVDAGTVVAMVFDLSGLGLVAEVDETDVLLVRAGVPASVELDALPGASYDALVTSVELSPTTSARGGVTYRVRLRLGPGKDQDGRPAPAPRPGMSAVAGLRVRAAHDAVVVPAAAVIRSGNHDAVWVVRDGRVRQQVVTLGAQGDDVVQVSRGLRLGDRVVVRGADLVRDGQQV